MKVNEFKQICQSCGLTKEEIIAVKNMFSNIPEISTISEVKKKLSSMIKTIKKDKKIK